MEILMSGPIQFQAQSVSFIGAYPKPKVVNNQKVNGTGESSLKQVGEILKQTPSANITFAKEMIQLFIGIFFGAIYGKTLTAGNDSSSSTKLPQKKEQSNEFFGRSGYTKGESSGGVKATAEEKNKKGVRLSTEGSVHFQNSKAEIIEKSKAPENIHSFQISRSETQNNVESDDVIDLNDSELKTEQRIARHIAQERKNRLPLPEVIVF